MVAPGRRRLPALGVINGVNYPYRLGVQVRRAQDARQLAVAAVQLAAALRRTVLPLNWERLPAQPAPEPPPLPPGLFNVSAIAMSGAPPLWPLFLQAMRSRFVRRLLASAGTHKRVVFDLQQTLLQHVLQLLFGLQLALHWHGFVCSATITQHLLW